MGLVYRKATALAGMAVLAAGTALIAPPAATAAGGDTTVQILGTNDFHGRIDPDGQIAGAAVLAGAVKQLRGDHPDTTVFAGAGDQVGASTFPSFIADDNPTIDALNAAGLQVSSVGNHEFDKGYSDLTNRIQKRADWPYLGANVKKKSGGDALPPSWTTTLDGVKVGFVGAVTTHLNGLVSPSGIKNLKITNIAKATNTAADKLKADGADIVILLVHQGAPKDDDCAQVTDNGNDFGKIINHLDANVDAVISGHTHVHYNCTVPVQAWKKQGRAVTARPVMQTGKYGTRLDQILFTVNSSGKVTGVTSKLLPLTKQVGDNWKALYPSDPTVEKIVADADAAAKVKGAKSLGKIDGPFDRAKTANGNENRGGESTLGNLVAQAQLVQTHGTSRPAQIAFMNPGGLRADIDSANGKYPADVSYKQAADVQPFGDTLVVETLTGAQIKTVLEQQWQPKGASRPILHLGISTGFTYTYNPTAAKGHHITAMWLNGKPVTAKSDYVVAANSFLAAGGDQFFELAKGSNVHKTGLTDLEGFVDYMHKAAGTTPLPVDSSQRSVGVTFTASAPAAYKPGSTVAFRLSSLTFPAPKGSHQAEDSTVTVSLSGTKLGTFPVDNAPSNEKNDETGTANVSVRLPESVAAGHSELTIVGNHTGTRSHVAIDVAAAPAGPAGTVPPRAPGAGAPGVGGPGVGAGAPPLANTGVKTGELAALGLLLLAVGAGLTVTGRRRRA